MTLEQRYTDLEATGASRLGDVFTARHATLGRVVRICRLSAGITDRDALFERLRAVAQLQHPNIAAVIDADFDADPAFFVTDGAQGDSLRERLDGGRMPHDAAVRAVRDLFRGLAHAHEHGVPHGSLGPSRLHFDATNTLRIADFGTQAATADPSGATVAIDTDAMPYLPVHVLRNPDAYDDATDFHCAGALALHMLLGEVVEGAPPSTIDGISEGAVAALHALLSRDATLDTLRSALAAFDHAPVAASATPAAPTTAAIPAEEAPQLARPSTPRRRISSGTMVMATPVGAGDTGAHPAALPGSPATGTEDSVGHDTAALERLAGRPNRAGETLLENPYEDPSQSVLEALGGAEDDDEPPMAAPPVEAEAPDDDDIGSADTPAVTADQTEERNAALFEATARAREARERAQEKMAKYAALLSS